MTMISISMTFNDRRGSSSKKRNRHPCTWTKSNRYEELHRTATTLLGRFSPLMSGRLMSASAGVLVIPAEWQLAPYQLSWLDGTLVAGRSRHARLKSWQRGFSDLKSPGVLI